jgi:hypothetical protein
VLAGVAIVLPPEGIGSDRPLRPPTSDLSHIERHMKTSLRILALSAAAAAVSCSAEATENPATTGGGTTHETHATTGEHAEDHAEEAATHGATSQPTKQTGALLDESKWEQHLAGVHVGERVALARVLENPKDFEGKVLRVEAPIHSVCQMSGCWMRIGEGERNMMVNFEPYSKEYHLMDAAGGKVLVEGTVHVQETSVDELRHLAEDAGRSPEEIAKITEPKVEPRFKATGYARPKE